MRKISGDCWQGAAERCSLLRLPTHVERDSSERRPYVLTVKRTSYVVMVQRLLAVTDDVYTAPDIIVRI